MARIRTERHLGRADISTLTTIAGGWLEGPCRGFLKFENEGKRRQKKTPKLLARGLRV